MKEIKCAFCGVDIGEWDKVLLTNDIAFCSMGCLYGAVKSGENRRFQNILRDIVEEYWNENYEPYSTEEWD